MFDYEREYTYAAIDDLKGRTVTGTVVKYGEHTDAITDGRQHRYVAGAFGNIGNLSIPLTYLHNLQRQIVDTDSGMVLTDSPTELRIKATLPNTVDGNDAVEGIKSGFLKGFSGHTRIRESVGKDGEDLAVYNASLLTVGIVPSPAFPSSTISEMYMTEFYANGEGIEGEFSYDQDTIISADKKTRKERVKPGAFTYAIEQPDREINLFIGDNSRPLGSKKGGTLKLEDTDKALKFRVEKLPNTSYTADLIGALKAGSVVPGVVPFFSATPTAVASRIFSDGLGAVIEQPEKGNPGVFRRIVRSALLTGLSILFRPPRGNPGAVRVIQRQRTQPDYVRPIAGDEVRNGRVFRSGVDIGPAFRRRRVM